MKISKSRGFTLIELLVVIAIIGILAGIVIVSLTSAQDRAQRTSAMSSLRSVIPELVTCDAAGGHTTTYIISAGTKICYNNSEFSATWPTLSNGWAYGAYATNTATGSPANGDLQFGATKTGAVTIACSMSTGSCR